MYAIHTTPGFIIGSRPYGEAGRMLSIFTRDLGLVTATAQGIRLEKSKLRYHTQPYSFGTFSLVRGKEFWRLTSAASGRGARAGELAARVALLLRRLLQGEEPHPELYEHVEACARFMGGHAGLSADDLKALESLTVLRILHALGYVGDDDGLGAALASTDLDQGLLREAAGKRTAMNRHINKALAESHL